MSARFTLYQRQGCHLCEDMQAALVDFGLCVPDTLISLDVDSNPDWVERYGSLVPVLESPLGEVCHYFLDAGALRQHMQSLGEISADVG